MSTTVLLIRHPESSWNRRGIYQGRKDIPLSELGQIQAELVAQRLRHEPLAGVVCSPLSRAQRLASAIADAHGLKPVLDVRLTEIAHGSWEGLTRADVRARYPEMYDAWERSPHKVSFPGGESLPDVHYRSVAVIEDLLARPGDDVWVVVTHDTVARLVVAAAQHRPVVGFSDVTLENAGITTLTGPQLVGSVKGINDVTHLGAHRVDIGVQAL